MSRQPSSLPGRPITRAPALVREQVAEYLRDGITSLRLKAGTPLIEREICEATTASRTTVREALRQLETEGLVEVDPGRGAVVKRLSSREVREIYAVRAQLEGLTCQLFAKHSTEEQRIRLRAAVQEMARYQDDPLQMLDQKELFYEVLYEGADNHEVKRLLQGLSRRIKLVQATSLTMPGRPARSLREIEGIVEALEQGDGDLARERCIAHIEAAAATMMDMPHAEIY
ncbi:GntR family transcriptional regulator [Leucobacter soli]|uniref:HTH-type transcriptional repressor RspR n=1 Tax=Leucobacter soli TaxID=2812850 RepID=A0A916NIB8_9MICO|nr:GntR family transcriptional regulator [Leucobacter soli]CAG7615679.1 HTH-type transcriptional repressor RspR [Leucobacter soli]